MRPRQKTQFVEIVGKVGDILKQERHFEGRRHFEAGKTTGKVDNLGQIYKQCTIV